MTAAPTSKLVSSSPSNPCPICGRADKSGKCRYSDDGPKWLCHKGTTHHPPIGLKIGELHLGQDFQNWAYTKEAIDNRTSVFKLHEEKRPTLRLVEAPKPALLLARLSLEAKPAKGIVTAAGTYYAYSDTQRVQRTVEKQFFSHHRSSSDEAWSNGAGAAPWPLYNEQEALAASGWLLELEGEKTVDIASANGLVAISQPGNKALLKQELVVPRYQRLRDAGIQGIVYLADFDEAGKEKGIALEAAAAEAGLPFVLLAAEELWPHLPKGGSIDDLTAEELAGAAEKLEKAADLFVKQPKAPATTAKKPENKEKTAPAPDDDKATAKAIAALLEKLLEATLAEDQPLVDALRGRAWGYQLTREVLQERLLACWAKKRGLLDGAKAPARSRIIGEADPGPGLQQLQPGFALKNDLHALAADAGVGKTFTTLELATCISIGAGFMDQQEGRAGKEKAKVLYVASDGGASAWAMVNDYCDALQTAERGALIEVWAEDPEAGEAAWNVSLPNLERLAKRMEKGDLAMVVIDTANACFQSAGVSPYTGPVDQYLRLLKAIVCPSAALWINCHTTRSGQGMKAVGGHPAWQEVPSAVHRIEKLKKEEGEAPVYKWTVEKFRGESPRSFNYHRVDGEFQLVGGSHFQENISDLLLRTIQELHEAKKPTKPSALAEATKRSSSTVWMALTRLRQRRLIRSQGTGNRLTDLGLARLAELEEQAPKAKTEALEEFF
jgi:TusA-related sulfurtransferase